MFTASWADRNGFSPYGWAVVEHARYLSSLSDEALYDAIKNDRCVILDYTRAASCQGLIIRTHAKTPGSCTHSFEQLSPQDLIALASYRDHLSKYAMYDPNTMTGGEWIYASGMGYGASGCQYLC